MGLLPGAAGDASILFIVGKGGVGKSTAAGALALESADDGVETHLVSTDPAHSLGDLFEEAISRPPTPSRCSPRLTIEEFDAPAYAEAWLASATGPVAEIIEGGTYLDAEDVAGFTRLALPGVDEMMAVLRLVDLADGGGRIVVDTAPTGHALRLLDAAGTHEAIARALRAMAAKAAAVASGLARQQVRLSGESIIRELEQYVEAFRTGVLERAAFVVAARAEGVVLAETARLHDALRERRLTVAATVFTGEPPRRAPPFPGACLVVPLLAQRTGCDGLRGWRQAVSACPAADAGEQRPAGTVREPTADPAGGMSPAGTADSMTPTRVAGDPAAAERATGDSGTPDSAAAVHTVLERLAPGARKLLLFAGKGGVGKTTCAAATAVALAGSRSVLLCSTDPAGSLEDVLGAGGVAPQGLRVIQIDAAAHLQRLREAYRDEVVGALDRIGLSAAASLDRRVIEALFELAPPGIDEFAALAEMLDAAGSADLVVLDSAPTGHFLRLLTMPGLALDWTRQLMRIIVKYRAAGAAGAAAEALLQGARELRALQDLLHDTDRAAVVVVTLDEPMVHAETSRLATALQDAGIAVAATLLNRSSAGSTAVAGDGIRIRAPVRRPPPVGPHALREFLDSWKIDG
jgi:arsenite/tail-anchored protein-transporting ATPase